MPTARSRWQTAGAWGASTSSFFARVSASAWRLCGAQAEGAAASRPAQPRARRAGFAYDFPFLEDAGVVGVQDNRVAPLYEHVFPPAAAPTLSFVGLPFKVVPFPQFQLQSRWIARVLAGAVPLPPRQVRSGLAVQTINWGARSAESSACHA